MSSANREEAIAEAITRPPRLNLSPNRRAQLKPAQKLRVKTAKERRGFEAAISAAKRLAQ